MNVRIGEEEQEGCVSRSTLKLPRSKSPFNEKTIFVETERAKREEGGLSNSHESVCSSAREREWEIKALQRLPPFSPVLPSERIHCQELLLNLICYKTILSTALGIWAKNCPGILFFAPFAQETLSSSSCPETDLGISLLLCGAATGRVGCDRE